MQFTTNIEELELYIKEGMTIQGKVFTTQEELELLCKHKPEVRSCTFVGMRIPSMDFSEMIISETVFLRCLIVNANFDGCLLGTSTFIECDILSASMQNVSQNSKRVPLFDRCVIGYDCVADKRWEGISITQDKDARPLEFRDCEICALGKITSHSWLQKVINFNGSKLNGLDFAGHNLARSNFENTEIRKTIFDDCVLEDAEFAGATIGDSSFVNTDFGENGNPLNQAKKVRRCEGLEK